MRQRLFSVLPMAVLLLGAGTLTAAGAVYGGEKKGKAEMAAPAKVTISSAADA